MLNNNYVLIDCGLIHKYLIKKSDIKTIEEETFYTVEVIKDLSDYTIKNKEDKIVISNGYEVLTFKQVENCKDDIFRYFLDEFVELEDYSVDKVIKEHNKTLIDEKELRIFPQYFEDGEFIRDKNYHAKFYWNEYGCWVINELGKEVFVHNDFIYKSK